MNIETLKTACPAAFATHPRHDVSANYVFIPSEPIINRLYELDFEAVSVRMRHGNNSKTAAHTIRFQQRGIKPIVADCLPQIVLSNSHDRSRKFFLPVGLFRLVCSNGLTVAHWIGQTTVKTRHIGCIDIENSIQAALNSIPNIVSTVNEMQERALTRDEVNQLVIAGITAREGNNIPVSSLNLEQWNNPRRPADVGNSLWLTMNRLQENLIHGVTPRSATLSCPTRIERINTTLWSTAQAMLS